MVVIGSAMSVRSFLNLGSSFSLCGVARLGSSVSVMDFASFGSMVSVRSFIKVSAVFDGTMKSYMVLSTNNMYLYGGGARGLTLSSTGGQLHGQWTVDQSFSTSDRRLKRNIEPLQRTLAARARDRGSGAAAAGSEETLSSGRQLDEPVSWLLRELRPVSFNLKRGPEAKYLKFGFVAQELETVFPNLVRTVGEDDTKSVAHQDLIAVLTLALQTLQKELEDHRREMEEQRERMERLEEAVMAYAQANDVVI